VVLPPGTLASLSVEGYMHYTPPIVAATLAAAIAVFACSESDSPTKPSLAPAPGDPAALVGCIGVPGGMTANWPQQRVFLESQGWWGEKNGTTVPRLGDAEHIHIGMCFPLQKTVSGNITLQVRVIGHNLTQDSKVTVSNLHDPDGGLIPNINWNHTIGAGETTNWQDMANVTINTDSIPDGLREFRNLTKVVRHDRAELHVSSGWCWDIENDANTTANPERDSGTCEDTRWTTMGRGWYDCFEYKIAEVDGFKTPTGSYPYGGVPSNTALDIYVGLHDGGGDHTAVTGWGVYLNPMFHNSNDDFEWSATGTGGAKNGLVTIPGQYMDPPLERITLVTHANGFCDIESAAGMKPQNGEVSGVLVIPVKVN
jgi:hypothetical protein